MRRRQAMAALTALHGAAPLDGATISRIIGGLDDAEVAAQKARYDAPTTHEYDEVEDADPYIILPMSIEAEMAVLHGVSLTDEHPEGNRHERRAIAKGACAKCGKVIGRGIAMHTKKCAGLTDGE